MKHPNQKKKIAVILVKNQVATKVIGNNKDDNSQTTCVMRCFIHSSDIWCIQFSIHTTELLNFREHLVVSVPVVHPSCHTQQIQINGNKRKY